MQACAQGKLPGQHGQRPRAELDASIFAGLGFAPIDAMDPRLGVLVPTLVGAVAIVPLSMYAMMPGVTTLAALLALLLLFSVIIATVSVVAITLNVPNEIRGLALGANVLATGMFGAALAPTLVGFVSSALGGETQLGTAVTAVSAPAALCAALFFYIAMRSASSDAKPASASLRQAAGG